MVLKRKRITLGFSYAQIWVVICDWCGKTSATVADPRNPEATLSRPDSFGHFFTFHKPGPDGKRHECHWCRSKLEWQAELEAIRQKVRQEIERERRQGEPPSTH